VAVEFVVPGWLVDHLIRRGPAETVVRKAVLIAGMVVALGIVGAAFTTNLVAALFWITVGTVGITLAYCVSNSLRWPR
jgi:small-conductance mechanosensitive channel